MSKLYIVIISILSFLPTNTEDDCFVVYNTAAYALSHSKKALKANNFDHQLYYSGKTLESYNKIMAGMENCGCKVLADMIEDITNDAEKAADPVDWARGRYYSKKVYQNTLDLITVLDEYTAANTQTETPSEQDQ